MEVKTFAGGLMALDRDENCLGKLYGTLTSSRHFVGTNLEIFSDGEKEEVAVSLFEEVKKRHPNVLVHFMSWKKEESKEYEALLPTLGYKILYEKKYFFKDIVNYKSPYCDLFEYEQLNKLDLDILLNILEDIRVKDPTEDLQIPVSEAYAELIENYRQPYATAWKVATTDKQIVGIILPDIFSDEPKKGTLGYIGVTSSFRQKGWAKILHAKGLEEITKLGATKYWGSTHVENIAMAKVFESNGCTLAGIRRHWSNHG